MKTYELTFAIESPNEEKETFLDIDGILQDAIRDCSLEYKATLIKVAFNERAIHQAEILNYSRLFEN